jgi:hypothetical protein
VVEENKLAFCGLHRRVLRLYRREAGWRLGGGVLLALVCQMRDEVVLGGQKLCVTLEQLIEDAERA